MKITKIIFDNGMEINGISEKQSESIFSVITSGGGRPREKAAKRKGFRRMSWSDQEDTELKEAIAVGMDKKAIRTFGKKFNRTNAAVYARINVLKGKKSELL